MSYETFEIALGGIPYKVTEHDGQVIFEENGGFYGSHGRFAFCYLEQYDRWDLIDEDQSHGGVYTVHLQAAIEVLRMDFPKGTLDRCPRPEFVFIARHVFDGMQRHHEECRCEDCRRGVRLKIQKFDTGKRNVYIRLGKNAIELWWGGRFPKLWWWRRYRE